MYCLKKKENNNFISLGHYAYKHRLLKLGQMLKVCVLMSLYCFSDNFIDKIIFNSSPKVFTLIQTYFIIKVVNIWMCCLKSKQNSV